MQRAIPRRRRAGGPVAITFALSAGGLLGAAGCGHGASSGTTRAAPVAASAVAARPLEPAVGGVWEWQQRSTDEQGDLRVEREEWHLDQKGQRLAGYYDRAVTVTSQDERPFRCNQRLGFTKFTRVRVEGLISDGKMALRETSYETRPDPCDDGARNLVRYIGRAEGEVLRLQWTPPDPDAGEAQGEGAQELHRAGKNHPPLAALAGVADGQLSGPRAATSEPGASSLSGTWVWELKSVDAEGDERIEREEWTLEEGEAGITGFYDRKVERRREGGTFACNNSDHFETVTRYAIHGSRLGDRIRLSEVDYKVAPSPCDNTLRRLDKYQGSISSDGDELLLSWGPGNQLLRRKK